MADRFRILTCVECGEEFVFTTAGQEYFSEIGYIYDPKRCKSCHASYKRRQRNTGAAAGEHLGSMKGENP